MRALVTTALVSAVLQVIGCASRPDSCDSPRGHEPFLVQMCTSEGDIDVELDPAHAPVSVANFLEHTWKADYDGTIFHRVVPGFVVQGGGWNAELQERAKIDAAAGRPDRTISNEWQNGLANDRGTIAMAREEAPDTAAREFYFNLADNARLSTAREKTGNAGYAVFGRVVRGMDVIDRIAAAPTAPRQVPGVTDGSMENVPVQPVTLRCVRVIRPAGGRR